MTDLLAQEWIISGPKEEAAVQEAAKPWRAINRRVVRVRLGSIEETAFVQVRSDGILAFQTYSAPPIRRTLADPRFAELIELLPDEGADG